MKGDFSRSTFDRKNHYKDVLLQQGRALLDADWNEHSDIETYLRERHTQDMIGNGGVPQRGGGFEIDVSVDNKNIILSAGRIYVDGIVCENNVDVSFSDQPDFPQAVLPKDPGTYLAYLDTWPRHITALEDSTLREVALDGPETTTRIKTIWQVKLQKVDDSVIGKDLGPDWKPTNVNTCVETTGSMTAFASKKSAKPDNCLYRVEIHDDSKSSKGPTFKWSRENGAVVGRIEEIKDNIITISMLGCLPEVAFAIGQWVELSDEEHDLHGMPGELFQLLDVTGNDLTLIVTDSAPIPKLGSRATVRLWDSPAGVIPLTQDEIHLEHGIYIQFSKGEYRSGDYWAFPTRAITADVEWPLDNFQPPHGVVHHYCQLAFLKLKDDQTWELAGDCRHIFPVITELTSFFYISGDGQEAIPGEQLIPLQLQVGVANGQWPLKNSRVKFSITSGNGNLGSSSKSEVEVLTNAEGLASCSWLLDIETQHQQVEATLLNAAGETVHLPIRFNASLSRASAVAYTPLPSTPSAPLKDTSTVQQALDRLDETKVNRAGGDTITGLLKVDELTVKGTLTTRKMTVFEGTTHQGLTELGDDDKDEITVHGVLRTAHSSNALQVADPLHVGSDKDVEKIMVGVSGILDAKEFYQNGEPLVFGVSRVINQLAHGFSVGQAIYFDPATRIYKLARSDNQTTVGLFLVAKVKNENQFTLVQAGHIAGLSGLKLGEYYYVSDKVAGALVSDEPLGGISNPILYATSESEGYVLPYQPSETSEELLKEYVDNLLVGSVVAFAMQEPPDGWLECNGYTKSRTDYKRLFEKIGITYGAGDGAKTFNLPDLRGEFVRGWDHGRGIDPGREVGKFQLDQIQTHKHGLADHSHWYADIYYSERWGSVGVPGAIGGNTGIDYDNNGFEMGRYTGGSGLTESAGPLSANIGNESRPRNISLMYCIKY